MTRVFLGSCIVLWAGLNAAAASGQSVLSPGQWVASLPYVEMKGVTPISEYGGAVGYIDGGGWVSYGPFTFEDGFTDRMEIDFAAPSTTGRLTVHLDSPQGPRIAEFRLVDTGGDYGTFRIQQTDAEQVDGTYRLVFVFHDGEGIGNLRAFRLLTPQVTGAANALRYDQVAKETPTLEESIAQLLAAHEAAILEHRTSLTTIRGTPGEPVRVRQLKHAFPFGTAIAWRPFFDDSDMPEADRMKYLEVLESNFNSVVHENELKWYHNEPEKDQVSYIHADRMIEWAEARGMEVRGHCVFWGREKVVQKWQQDLDDEELLRRMKARARDVVSRYRGRVSEWEVNNEMLDAHYYSKRFGTRDVYNQMFHWVREHDPDVLLYVNDYSILTGDRTEMYVEQIRAFLDAGVPLGGIGVQGHFFGRAVADEIKAKLDRLAQFGLPIRVTEFDATTNSEDMQARTLATVYATCFAHPAIAGITMWGFWEGAHW